VRARIRAPYEVVVTRAAGPARRRPRPPGWAGAWRPPAARPCRRARWLCAAWRPAHRWRATAGEALVIGGGVFVVLPSGTIGILCGV